MLWGNGVYTIDDITEMKVNKFHWLLMMMLDNNKVKAEQYKQAKGENVTQL